MDPNIIIAVADTPDEVIGDFITRVTNILRDAIGTIVPYISIICVIFIIYGGIQYITGGVKGAETGRKTIIAAITGLIIIAFSYLIINQVVNLVENWSASVGETDTLIEFRWNQYQDHAIITKK